MIFVERKCWTLPFKIGYFFAGHPVEGISMESEKERT